MQAFAIFAVAVADYGVTPGQSWSRTTNVGFGISVRGEGLSSFDTLRLITAGRSCNEDSGDVKSYDASMLWNCPNINSGCVRVRGPTPVDIPVQVYQWNCTTIDRANSCSGLAGITSISVDSEGIVKLVFSGSPPLENGAVLKIGAGVACGANCDSDKLNLLLGGSTDPTSDDFKVGTEYSQKPLTLPGPSA